MGTAGFGTRGVGPDVRATLLLCHRHPEQRAGLARCQLWTVLARIQSWQPFLRQIRRQPEGLDSCMAHGNRAGMAGLNLREQHELRRTQRIGAPTRSLPCGRVSTRRHSRTDDPVVRRMVLNFVNPMPVLAVCAQDGWVLVGQPGVVLELSLTHDGAADFECSIAVRFAYRAQIIPERNVQRVFVDINARRRLVQHAVLLLNC